jgi:PAS domain S-box-containing protein
MKIDTVELPIFCMAVDTQCRVMEWNPMASKITGLAKQDVLGKDVGDCLSTNTMPKEADAKGIKSIIIEVFRNNADPILEILVPCAGDRECILLLNISLLHDENGSLVGAILVGQDIKEHKRPVKRLEKSQMADGQSIRNLFEKTTTLIIGMDSSGLINIWNIQMMEVTGFSKEESVGQNFVKVRMI